MTYDIDIFKPSTTTEKTSFFLFHRLVGSNWAGPYHHRRDHQGHVFRLKTKRWLFFSGGSYKQKKGHYWSLK